MESISDYIIYFMIFSVFGYLLEMVGELVFKRKLTGRGFLFGPYLPVYGFGGLIIIACTSSFRDNLALTILISMLTCSFLEFMTSYWMEKIFKVRWWDYTKTDAFNLNGRVCLRSALLFGLSGAILSIQVFPVLQDFVLQIPSETRTILACAISAIILVDTIISSYANGKIRQLENIGEMVGDQTVIIKKNAKKAIAQAVKRKKK